MNIQIDNLFRLALIWGIVGTWWVGLFLGVPLAFVCRFGSKPKLTIKDVVRPVLVLLVVLYVSSMSLGVVGFVLHRLGWCFAPTNLFGLQSFAAFQFNCFAHDSAYLLGAIGGIVLMFRLWKKRQPLNP